VKVVYQINLCEVPMKKEITIANVYQTIAKTKARSGKYKSTKRPTCVTIAKH
jgi:hypothetical protein